MKGDIHVCDRCGTKMIEEEGWSDEEAKAEAERLFGPLKPDEEERATLCEDCYVLFKKFYFSQRN